MPRIRRRAVTIFWSRSQDERLVALHELRTLTSDQIAHEMWVTRRDVVYRAAELRRRGWTVPSPVRAPNPVVTKALPTPRLRWTPQLDAQLRRMRDEGRSGRVIAHALGATPAAVYTRSHCLGLPLRNRRTA